MNNIDFIMKDCIECNTYFKVYQNIASHICKISSFNQIDSIKYLSINHIIPRYYILQNKLLDYSIISNSYFIGGQCPISKIVSIDDCYFLVDSSFNKELITDEIYQYLVLLSLNENEHLILATDIFFSNNFFLIYFKDNQCNVWESLSLDEYLNMSTILLRCSIDFSLYNKINELLEVFESFILIRKL